MVVQIKQTSYYTDNYEVYEGESLFSAILTRIDDLMGDVRVMNYIGLFVGTVTTLGPFIMIMVL